MGTRSEQLQIRVTPREKAALKRLARAAGQDVSAYVLGRVLPPPQDTLEPLIAALHDDSSRSFALAELHDRLVALAPVEFAAAAGTVDVRGLPPWLQNYVAALVEQAAQAKGSASPVWTRDVAPLEEPYFATPLAGLRSYLIRTTPLPFKRRNVFTDAGLGTRV